jgi:hypothetical protein
MIGFLTTTGTGSAGWLQPVMTMSAPLNVAILDKLRILITASPIWLSILFWPAARAANGAGWFISLHRTGAAVGGATPEPSARAGLPAM